MAGPRGPLPPGPVIGIKLALSAAVLAAGLAGGCLPLWRGGDPSGGRLLGWGNALAAGVFLGAGMIHMLPEAAAHWDALFADYPMAYLNGRGALVGADVELGLLFAEQMGLEASFLPLSGGRAMDRGRCATCPAWRGVIIMSRG